MRRASQAERGCVGCRCREMCDREALRCVVGIVRAMPQRLAHHERGRGVGLTLRALWWHVGTCRRPRSATPRRAIEGNSPKDSMATAQTLPSPPSQRNSHSDSTPRHRHAEAARSDGPCAPTFRRAAQSTHPRESVPKAGRGRHGLELSSGIQRHHHGSIGREPVGFVRAGSCFRRARFEDQHDVVHTVAIEIAFCRQRDARVGRDECFDRRRMVRNEHRHATAGLRGRRARGDAHDSCDQGSGPAS